MNEGQEVGNYILEARIGKGGMGSVFRGRHKSLGTPAAIKVISAASNEDPESRERFSREARTQARLRHPNIAQVFDHVELEGRWYLISEYLPAGTLRDVLEETRGPVEPEKAVAWSKQALAGLEYAHRQKVIHRDIKPANLLLDENGQVSVTDFGLAIMLGDHRLTSTGLAIGTPQYMSPEQINGAELDHRTDIYSMGAVVYELLTGQVPFPLQSTFEMYRILVKEAPAMTSINAAIPEALDNVVARALEKNPADRYASCAEFSDAIDHAFDVPTRPPVVAIPVATDTEFMETRPSAEIVTPPPAPPPANHHPERTVIAILVVLFLLGSSAVGWAMYSWLRSRAATSPTALAALTTSLPDGDSVGSQPGPSELDELQADAEAAPELSLADSPDPQAIPLEASIRTSSTSSTESAEAANATDRVPPSERPSFVEESPSQNQLEMPVASAATKTAELRHPSNGGGSAPARTPTSSSLEIESRTPTYAVITTGDPLLAEPLEAELEARLRTEGLQIWDERSSLVLFDLLSDGQRITPGLLVPELERSGVSVLVLADVVVRGYRDLYYYGRHSVATRANLHFNAFDLTTALAIGTGWTEEIEYTELTAETKATESLIDPTRDLLVQLSRPTN